MQSLIAFDYHFVVGVGFCGTQNPNSNPNSHGQNRYYIVSVLILFISRPHTIVESNRESDMVSFEVTFNTNNNNDRKNNFKVTKGKPSPGSASDIKTDTISVGFDILYLKVAHDSEST